MKLDIFVIGVGGQGIGLLSETIIRAADHAGLTVKGVDTHGLAQRGGMVTSHIRIGEDAFSPLIMPGLADMVLALEIHEALRGLNTYLRDKGTLVYYSVSLQPLNVRLGKEKSVTIDDISRECKMRSVKEYAVSREVPDPRMQNIAILGTLARERLIDSVEPRHYEMALEDLLSGKVLELNLNLFRSILAD
ncbi:indolepyruvate ferredoxin oxidoreductase beta subunit [Acetomicrobium thermoterrenum DSM 13490]|jgi:indolepyruvate ferredoxin oxidoreductase beta subunit|uniref:Indolepyruvate ferredoxin oxidoreductase beta subunit n=1 Tax=Acetomicrobium thermoterrenum DSM 13490 TaxID=1120987 RepID=A0A1H3E587_9BACT|nr:2-oxoacid:acceptor oxidoreductase family protein [Acetomicrobium thermoterrenum]SDX73903.1 indolepyruvate ferredoxin oxidoreductase beta subunit [Acetomicrobium thermoterrenum DSM 13490]